MSTITDIPTTARIAVLKHAINGKADNFIAGATGLSPAQVLDIKAAHGYPDLDKMDWAVDVLTKQVEGKVPTPPRPAPSTAPRVIGTRPVVPAFKAKPAAPAVVEHREPHASANELLVAASKSPKKRTQALGAKIAGLLERLVADLTAEDEATQARAKAEAADRKRKERIAQLEAELRKLKKQKPGTATTTPTQSGDHECDICGRAFATVQALRMHERRAHEGFDPRAAHAERESA